MIAQIVIYFLRYTRKIKMSYISVNDLMSNEEPFKYKCLQLIKYMDLDHKVQARANNPILINQSDAPLCGPAAFLYCITKSNPENYKQYIYNLAQNGIAKIKSMEIKPSEDCKNADIPAVKIDPIDWVGLASLRDNTNKFLSMSSVSDNLSVNLAGITTPKEIACWFTKTELFKQIINKTNLFLTKAISNLVNANNYYRNGYKVCLLINSTMLLNPSNPAPSLVPKLLPTKKNIESEINKFKSNIPNHWVVFEGNMALGNEYFNGDIKTMEEKIKNTTSPISFKVYSWGRIYPVALNWDILSSYYYGYIAVK